jgi:acetyl-CoA carboxylase alpha subunit|tara:strand:- start:387 stop:512 length:126 start_codon:yes stop_codon:yes gene_type:complete
MYKDIASAVVDEVQLLKNLALDDLIDRRRKKFRAIGEFQEI